MASKAFITIAVLLSTVALIAASPIGQKRIFNSELGEHIFSPYVVSFGIPTESQYGFDGQIRHHCGGAILSNKFIVTAAACLPKYVPLSDARVFATGYRLFSDGQTYEVKQFIRHPKFENSETNNIALVELASPIVFSQNVSAIELDRTFVGENEHAIVYGYGRDLEDFRYSGNYGYLQFKGARVVSNDDCRKMLVPKFPPYTELGSSTLCAWIETVVADRGDPIVRDNKLIGLSAWYYRDQYGQSWEYPDGFVRISEYADWIGQTMAANE